MCAPSRTVLWIHHWPLTDYSVLQYHYMYSWIFHFCLSTSTRNLYVLACKISKIKTLVILLSLGMLSDCSFSFHFLLAKTLQGHVCFLFCQLLFLLNQIIFSQKKFSSLNFYLCKFISTQNTDNIYSENVC